MSEFPELDKLAKEIEGGKPTSITGKSVRLLLVIGVLVVGFVVLAIYAFIRALMPI